MSIWVIRTEALPQQTPGWQVDSGVGGGVTVPLIDAETSTKLTDGSETDGAAEADAEISPFGRMNVSTQLLDWSGTVEPIGAAAVGIPVSRLDASTSASWDIIAGLSPMCAQLASCQKNTVFQSTVEKGIVEKTMVEAKSSSGGYQVALTEEDSLPKRSGVQNI